MSRPRAKKQPNARRPRSSSGSAGASPASPLDRLRQTSLAEASPAARERLAHAWPLAARPEQLEPDGDWRVWLLCAGRGFGKTRAGAEWVRSRVRRGYRRVALIAPTEHDAREVMLDGDSGLLRVGPNDERPRYEPSRRRLVWPNGAVATLFSADQPERLRGPQHDLLWADELAAWRHPSAWDTALMGLRLGPDPRACVTTTPRATELVRRLLADPSVVVTRGRTLDNAANLAPAFLNVVVARYDGTRLGRQELDGELLVDTPGALWSRDPLDAQRVREAPELARVVVAVDPAVTSAEDADETGIVVVGKGLDGRAYVLDDRSLRASPDGWAREVARAFDLYRADRVVGEVNNGGDLVESLLRTVRPGLPYRAVRASRGKRTRAEPVAALYEQGRVSHVGAFPALEDQMCAFTPDAPGSPDRVDALVYAIAELALASRDPVRVVAARPH